MTISKVLRCKYPKCDWNDKFFILENSTYKDIINVTIERGIIFKSCITVYLDKKELIKELEKMKYE